ncbi:Uncharacterized protein YneR [Amphibacillus marinus]|uniref:Uncharacterized protein YneR n=1 Tax=Amphibacillus marinus TaxID=872970 RepID=A0A1H8MFL8_9BACI|nr:HesB/YadR/YfhF family protein [Amphibacillus marinus]SEO16113.1 Uncharacterized protein YneR [Amphibacillus marinus]
MEINISQPAYKWLVDELELTDGDAIRFFVRYGGHSGAQAGFSLGISKNDTPFEPAVEVEVAGVNFFIEAKDEWYFDGKDLKVKYSRNRSEIEFALE